MPSISDNGFDTEWVAKAQGGDELAQQAIYLHFSPQVYKLARHILQCEASAEEVVQECFVDVICKIGQFRHQGSFAGWLRRIAVNHCLMLLRSSWIKKRRNIDDLEPHGFEDLRPQGSDEHSDHVALRQLQTVFVQLPAQARAVLWLHDVEGYTHGEIAKMMGKTTSFSKSQLARAYDKIRSQFNRQTTPTSSLKGDGVQPCMPLLNNF